MIAIVGLQQRPSMGVPEGGLPAAARRAFAVGVVLLACLVANAGGQLAPEIGYMHPAGGAPGQTLEVTLGGYDWTPDMQLLVHDPRIGLELLGPPGPVLVPDPPYWFGAKARGYAWPLPREFRARLTIPADVAPGLITWQVANANGASPPAQFQVDATTQVVEVEDAAEPQVLPSLPVTIAGRIRKIEEVDRYRFEVPAAGPVSVLLVARRIGSPLHAMVRIVNSRGQTVADVADSEGIDSAFSFVAEAGLQYTLSLHDLDFAGDRSYVYRLSLSRAPRVLAAYPAAGRAGETRLVEFLGPGVATGGPDMESVAREVAFPADRVGETFPVMLETPFGKAAPIPLLVSDGPELAEPAGGGDSLLPAPPCAVTASIETQFGQDLWRFVGRTGETWRISAGALSPDRRLDLELAILAPDGRELARIDDSPGGLNPELTITLPGDGEYRVLVLDRSGRSGSRAACYRLALEQPRGGFTADIPPVLALSFGESAKWPIKLTRRGGFAGPVTLAVDGLPEGVVLQGDPVIPGDKSEVTLDLVCSPDAPANARLATITATTVVDGTPVQRVIGRTALAVIFKPRIKLTPEGLDDVRKVHRGSTFPAPILIGRLAGFEGEIVLEMTAKQQRHRQGLASDEYTVLRGATRVEYPIFVPEWLETTKTSRMILNGAVQLPDPQGHVRTLLQRQELRIGILPEGALLKLAHAAGEPRVTEGGEFAVPITLSRAAEFREPVTIELAADLGPGSPPAGEPARFTAEPLRLTGDETTAALRIRVSGRARLNSEQTLRLRATALREGKWKVMSETELLVLRND